MSNRISCDAYHFSDGACCKPDEPCCFQSRKIHITPMIDQPSGMAVRPLWQAVFVLVVMTVLGAGLVMQERADERRALVDQESIAWFKLDRSIRR